MPCLLVMAGCEKEIEVHPSPAVTQAVFDPGASPPAVPTPTDLVKNPDTGLLNVPVADETTSPAQAYFDRYLNTLTGYPTSAVAEVRFDNEIDGKTIGKDTLPVFDITSTPGTPVRLTDLVYDYTKTASGNCASPCLVRIWNYAGWKRGTTYVAFVISGASGVKDKDGKPVVRSATFELVTSPAPLCAWDPNRSIDATQGCVLPAAGSKATGCCTFNYSALIESQVKAKVRASLKDRPVEEVEGEVKRQIIIQATQLERVRQGYGALLAMLAPAQGGWMSGLKRDDVALLWNWTTVSGNEAVFDPTVSRVPSPTDLAINPATGLLNIPTASTASPAEKEFNAYLSSLNGYPTSISSATLEVIGDVDPATVSGNVLVYTVSPTGLTAVPDVTVSYDGTAKRLLITLKGGFAKYATTYAIFAVGGEKGLKGSNGKPLQRSTPMALVLSPSPLCTYDATMKRCNDVKISSLIDEPKSKPGAMTGVQKATSLEQVRLMYAPVMKGFSIVAPSGKKADDVAALWTITTVSMTEVITNPTASVIPFPNNLLMDPAKLLKTPPEYQVKLPAPAGETATQKALREQLNTFDGFTTQGPYFAPTSGAVDPASLTPTAAMALNLDKLGAPAPMVFSFLSTAPAIVAKPQQPLDEKTNYAIVLISRFKAGDLKPADAASLRDDKGRRLVPSAFTVLTRNRYPLVENGKSTISTLDLATAAQAEALRGAQKPLFDALELLGIKREDVVAAWTFHTMTVTADLPKIRAFPWQLFGAVDSNKPTWTGALAAAPTGMESAVGGYLAEGSFVSWNILDEQGSGAFLPNPAEWATKGKASLVPLLVAVPCQPGDAGCTRTAARPAAGWPVAVYAHGVNQGKVDALKVLKALTAAGYAVVSFDFVYHGARAWCTKSAHCASGGSCDLLNGKCSSSLVDTNSDGKPDASGARFLNAANPFAVRDATRQSVIDAAALLRSIKLNAAAALTGSGSAPKPLDGDNIFWVSQSLGSQIGTLVLATDSLPKAAVFNVPGAPFPELAFYAPRWKDIGTEILTAQNVKEGSLDFLRLVNIFDWIYDPADSGNYAQYLQLKQLPDLVTSQPVTKKAFIVQLAEKDSTIPIQFGKYFATAAGLDGNLVSTKLTYAGQEHGFLLEPDPDPKATQAAQSQAVFFLNAPDAKNVCTPNLTAGTCP